MVYSRLGITGCLSFVVLSDMQHYFYHILYLTVVTQQCGALFLLCN